MAGPAYLKIWTTVLHNSKLLPLTLSERGFYLWLLVMCKEQRDDGQVFCRSYAALGQNCGCDLRTARKILGKLSQVCLLTHTVDEGGMIVIEIPNYKEWQELEVKEVLQKTRQNAETLHSTTQTAHQQSRAEQSRADRRAGTDSPHARLQLWIESEEGQSWLSEQATIYSQDFVGHESLKAGQWVKDNPIKGNKKNWKRFLGYWFRRGDESRSQDETQEPLIDVG